MKEYIQKVIIAFIQPLSEWFKISVIAISIGFFTRLSLVLIFFSSFYGYLKYTFLAILLGIAIDLSISYLWCLPLILYKICINNKFFISKAGQIIYYAILTIEIFIIVILSAFDLTIFKTTKDRISYYLSDFYYYKKIFYDIFFYRHYLTILACFIISLCIIIYLKKTWSKVKFKYEPPFVLKFVIAAVFLLSMHALWFKVSNINYKFSTDNRYVNMLPNNIINDILVFKKKTSIKIQEIDKNFIRENKSFINTKNGKNIILFIIEDISLENNLHLQNIAHHGINFTNAFMADKKHSLQTILYSDPLTNKCNAALAISQKYNTMFFNNFTKNKADFFNGLFYKCGFKTSKPLNVYKAILDNAKKNFFFIVSIKYSPETTDNEIFNLITLAKKARWFDKTVFIFAGLKNNFNSSKVINFDDYKVPLIFYGTSIDKLTVNDIASTIDIMPAIADLAGVSFYSDSLGRNMLSGLKKRALIIENNAYCSLTKYQKKITLH